MRINTIIDNRLSTVDLSEFTYDFICQSAKQTNTNTPDSWKVLDVRDLYDDDSNTLDEYRNKIQLACELLEQFNKVAIGCSHGISRSNAIALGVLMKCFRMDFEFAYELIKEKVDRARIKEYHLVKLRQLFKIESD